LLGDEAFPGQGRNRDEEMATLKRKLAKAEQKRDFLRDAAGLFGAKWAIVLHRSQSALYAGFFVHS
jgi:hypothetical protein